MLDKTFSLAGMKTVRDLTTLRPDLRDAIPELNVREEYKRYGGCAFK
jgi:hypothetical protein